MAPSIAMKLSVGQLSLKVAGNRLDFFLESAVHKPIYIPHNEQYIGADVFLLGVQISFPEFVVDQEAHSQNQNFEEQGYQAPCIINDIPN